MNRKIKFSNKEEFIYYYLNHTLSECAEKYEVSSSVIANRIRNYGIKHKKWWSDEEVNLLKKIYSSQDYSMDDILKYFPNRKKTRILSKAQKLGLKRPTNEDLLPKELTNKQHQILIGTLLGDGCLIRVKTQNSYFRFEQKEENKMYVKWIRDNLYPFCECGPKNSSHSGKIRNNDNKIINDEKNKLYSYYIYSKNHPIFTKLEKKWYLRDDDGNYIKKKVGNKGKEEKIKIVPRDLKLTPLIVAVWFFDDGCNCPKNKNAVFCTNGFYKEDCEFLVKKLKDNLGIKSNIVKVNKNNNQYLIRICYKSYLNFINMIKPFNKFEYFSHKTSLEDYTESWRMTESGLHPKNTSGHLNVCISNKKRYIPNVKINGKLIVGHKYPLTNKGFKLACNDADKAKKMKEYGETDLQKYKDMFFEKEILRSNNTSGYIGVYKRKNRKWMSSIRIDNKQIHLGYSSNKEESIERRKKAEKLITKGIRDPNVIKASVL